MLRTLMSPSGSERGGKHPAQVDFERKYYLTDKVLGKGSYAEVRVANVKETQLPVAVKVIDKGGLSRKEMVNILKEVNILQRLNHPNIVRILDYYDADRILYIVMEFVKGGELNESFMTRQYNEADVQRVIFTLSKGLHHCYKHGVTHRDLKPQNLLLEPNSNEVKLADFNLSSLQETGQIEFSLLETMCGTPNYVAPEVLAQKPYSYKCDIWGIGVIAYYLLSGGGLPFHVDQEGNLGRDLLLDQIRSGRWFFSPREAWVHVSDEAKDFLRKVIHPRPEQRLNYDELFHHPWLKNQQELMTETFSLQIKHRRKMLAAGKLLLAAKAFKSMTLKEEEDIVPDTKSVDEEDEFTPFEM